MRYGEAIAQLLSDYGVRDVFGIPGVHTIELYRGFGATGIATHVARHEQGAGFMADGYARITGRPGVCAVVTGPGLLNVLTPVAQAWHDSVPVLVIAAATRGGLRGRGPLHDVPDQVAAAAGAAGWSRLVERPEMFPELLAGAWAVLTAGRPRPACLSVPIDHFATWIDGPWPAPAVESPDPRRPTAEQLHAAAEELRQARRPVIIAGGGAVRRRGPDVGEGAGVAVEGLAMRLARVAEVLDAPVVCTGNGSGALDDGHPLAVGTLLPFSGARELIAGADVVLALGTEFSETDVIYTGIPVEVRGRLVRVDLDESQLAAHEAVVGVLADVGAFLSELLPLIEPGERRGGAARAAAARGGVEWTAQSQRHLPWLDALAGACPAGVVTVLDSTQLAYTAHQYVRKTGPWIAPYGLGTLGPALPMAAGVLVADPELPVLVIVGDGGLLFTLAELATAVDLGRRLVVVVWDNQGYGEIRDSFDRAGVPRSGTEVTALDLVTIARGFGAHAVRVDHPTALSAQVAAAFARAAVTVIVATADDLE
ncbi:thiamine pyrophosphate-binding protein [Winogradskya humida]|uniref:2-ketoarginine decarboxylase AruI n=1 Tax=Winogradskya humida TaxID=113566 RepID=A0ABQ4A491_9ACTN|nr:thiamine pyrophosphate-binding protein [Actinoplanes humidus]GIE25666.1 putative 2-ketoarginine decarboxylase AruI [Actinoplanes humidus]